MRGSLTTDAEGNVVLISPVCPGCGGQITKNLSDAQFVRLRSGDLIQNVFPDWPADLRERFISGYCSICWAEIFPPEEDDDD